MIPCTKTETHTHTHTHIPHTHTPTYPGLCQLHLQMKSLRRVFLLLGDGSSVCVVGGESVCVCVYACVCMCGREPDEAASARGPTSPPGNSKPVPSLPRPFVPLANLLEPFSSTQLQQLPALFTHMSLHPSLHPSLLSSRRAHHLSLWGHMAHRSL